MSRLVRERRTEAELNASAVFVPVGTGGALKPMWTDCGFLSCTCVVRVCVCVCDC